mmetsp:Transcript_25293/g.39115  ORF Transcript_25293/g.39115 Transcript_25293/m.39115 type:complete len:198 (+) Transcript_25293:573-1166(+)
MKAKELVAPFSDEVEVEVILFAGDHFVLENRHDAMNIYYPKSAAPDPSPANLKLTMRPIYCEDAGQQALDSSSSETCVEEATISKGDHPVVIYNKARERFFLEVSASLDIQHIWIDSLDSILPRGSPCLSRQEQCCTYDREANLVMNVSGPIDDNSTEPEYNCTQAFEQVQLSDNFCKRGSSSTLFKFIGSEAGSMD